MGAGPSKPQYIIKASRTVCTSVNGKLKCNTVTVNSNDDKNKKKKAKTTNK